MKRKLLRSFAVLAMALMYGNAWAAWDNTSAVYCPTNQTNYDDLNKAYDGIKDLTNEEITLEVYKDVNLTARFKWDVAKPLKVVPKANVSINRPGSYDGFLVSAAGNITIGSSEFSLTIKGNSVTNYQRTLFITEGKASITLENVTIKDIAFSTGCIFTNHDSKGDTNSKLYMKNVTVSNCSTTGDGLINNLKTDNDMIYLYNTITFDNCSGPYISTKGRIRLGENTNGVDNSPTITNPISINWTGATSTSTEYTNVIVKVPTNGLNNFYLTNENWGLYQYSADARLTEAYTAKTESNAKGAATLVLPFTATIPDGVKVYKLKNVNDNNTIETEEVKGTLDANTPVLINTTAEGGSYKFVSTATNHNSTTGSGTPTSGLLTGVYAETTVPGDSYILAKGESGVGFYKSKGSSKVTANHAYLTIPSSSSSAARAFFSIRFDDNGTTAIKGIDVEENKSENGTYNLNGVRMQNTNKKGLYIKNGKVFINQ